MSRRVKPLRRILAEGEINEHGFKRTLGPWMLAAMSVGSVIGAGIFVLSGVAAATRAGPALTISFIIAGIVAALAALCYAEVAGKIPNSGGSYTYAYATLGEFFAWLVGWGLLLRYGVSTATVSIGWSGYFVNFVQSAFGWNIPSTWAHSPFDPIHGTANLPAAIIVLIVTALLVRGTHESAQVNRIIVVCKLAVLLFFILIGLGHVHSANWHLPAGAATGAGGYFPFGWSGVFAGAAFIFFAYSGWETTATAAEESVNPKHDIPFAIITSLTACTVLYIAVVVVLTGMIPFNELNVSSPVAFAVVRAGLPWAGLLISLGALAGITTVLLVGMYGQSRVLFAMSRDGLVPKAFTRLHPVWRTPIFSSLFFGILMALLAAFTPIGLAASIANMGTLGTYIIVSFMLPLLRKKHPELNNQSFTVPFGPRLIPTLCGISAFGMMVAQMLRSPTVWGIPLPWVGYAVWFVIGILFYYAYGRKHSTVSNDESKAA